MLERADITGAMTSTHLDVPALARDRQVVVAADRIEAFGSLYCLRTSTDGRVWTSDTVIALPEDDGTWADRWSGGTTFGVPDWEDCWMRGWMTGGDTVAGEYETEDGTLATVMAVSGFAAPWVQRIVATDASGERLIYPQPPWNAFVVTALGNEVRLVAEGHDLAEAEPILFAVDSQPEPD